VVEGWVGGPWSAATCFVVPAIVGDDLGVLAAMRRSAERVRKVWGGELARRDGIGPVVAAAYLPALVLLPAGVIALGAFAGVTITLAYAAVVGALSTALLAIHLAVLYDYGGNGVLAEGVSAALYPVPVGAR
jgi:hypothetical protein